ncbi:hypothetical protein TrVGV298_002749 [Trichoderma virens]|nr:hypothetical protein TrVGV298_002749 [Trichoderma virens]
MKDDDQEQEQEKEFTIVEYTDARLPSDPAIRNVIRRHAMRNVAETRRQRDNYGRHSPKNPPTLTFEAIPKASSSTQPSSSEAVSAGHVDAPAKAIAPITWKYLAGPTAPLPMSTPEATIAENFAILHLVESLSGLHLGVNAQASSIPRLGLHKLQLPQSKTLLSFIPSRYGHVTPLTCAVDCLVARVRQITLKDDGFSEDRCLEVLHLYDKALKALQEAINDDEERKTPETLCAAELLGFFELLDGKSRAAHSWTRHAAGVAQLIQHQGADHFRTDFELALIAAYVGPLRGRISSRRLPRWSYPKTQFHPKLSKVLKKVSWLICKRYMDGWAWSTTYTIPMIPHKVQTVISLHGISTSDSPSSAYNNKDTPAGQSFKEHASHPGS